MAEALSGLEGALVATLNVTIPALVSPEEVDPETCQLLGPVALIVQAVMGVLVLGSLLLKRAREKPRRKWRVWTGDVSKQVLGQAFVHSANVAISDVFAKRSSDNPCSLYAGNIVVDTTIGVLILFAFLKGLTHLLSQHYPTSFRQGDYGDPFNMSIWAKQAAVYVLALALMKVVVIALFWAVPGMIAFATWCLSWIDSDEAQVVIVMLILPLGMNVLQFLIIDSILKSKSTALSPNLQDDEESRRGFLEPGSSDNDEDDDDVERARQQRPDVESTRSRTPPVSQLKRAGDPKATATSLTSGRGSGATSPSYPVVSHHVHDDEEVDDDEWGLGSGASTPVGSSPPTQHQYPPAPPHPSSTAPTLPPVMTEMIPPRPKRTPPLPSSHVRQPSVNSARSNNSSRSSFEDWDDGEKDDDDDLTSTKTPTRGDFGLINGSRGNDYISSVELEKERWPRRQGPEEKLGSYAIT